MVPSKIRVRHEHGGWFLLDGTVTKEEAAALFAVPGSEALPTSGSFSTRWMVVAWNGHEFETVEMDIGVSRRQNEDKTRVTLDTHYSSTTAEASMVVHYPLDPRTIAKDWVGATKAKHNEDGTCLLYTSPSPRDS